MISIYICSELNFNPQNIERVSKSMVFRTKKVLVLFDGTTYENNVVCWTNDDTDEAFNPIEQAGRQYILYEKVEQIKERKRTKLNVNSHG